MKSFYHLLGNTIISTITNFTVWFGLTFFVYLETRSVFTSSLVAGIYLISVALSGFWFGSLVDRYKKKHCMLVSSVISLAIYSLGFAIYLLAPSAAFKSPASLTLWVFIPLLLLGVIVGNIRGIAMATLVTILVPEERRDRANGLLGTASGIAFLIVSVISGILVGLAGMYWVLLLAIVMMVLTIIHLWLIPVGEAASVPSEGKASQIDIRGTLVVIRAIPGLLALIAFSTFNNFLGGVFMSLMDPYGLSLVSVEVWGLLWGLLSLGFIIGGLAIARWGLGRNPLRAMFSANIVIWAICSVMTIQPSIVLLMVGMFIYLCVVPYIEAAEHTILQKVVPRERQGRVFGFAQSVEQTASPLTALMIGPIAQFIFIPFMTTGRGVELIGGWFGSGSDRGIALVFTITGIIGLGMTLLALRSRFYRRLSQRYLSGGAGDPQPSPQASHAPHLASIEAER
ncbi:MAG: MFS transporter [Herpetosiphonaceae bacterium]|nr:MFS transporter [Herpetosiphonaceae bacterium]